jgi:hypothetical protein
MSDPPLDVVDRHSAATYFVLTIALSWAVWLPVLPAVDGPSALPIPFTALLLGGFGLLALGLVARYGSETLSVGGRWTPTWTGDQRGRRGRAETTGVEG